MTQKVSATAEDISQKTKGTVEGVLGGGGGGGGNSQECHRNYQGQSYGQVKCGACSSRTKTFNYIILFLFLQFLLVF